MGETKTKIISKANVYLIGIITVICITVINQFIIQRLLSQQKINARIENYASNQRILSQNIGRQVLRLYMGGEGTIGELKEDVNYWNKVHHGLQYGDEALGIPELESDSINVLFEKLNPIQSNIYNAIIQSESVEELRVNLSSVSDMWEQSFLLMEKIVRKLEQESDARINKLIAIEIILAVFSVIVLILVLLFILKPVINNLNRKQKKLEDTVAELALSNSELEAFSYSVSHDLRAPLRAIHGFSKILKDEYQETLDEEGNRILGIITKNSSKMGALIDDILAFSRLGRKEINRQSINLDRLTNEIIEDIKVDFEDHNMQIRKDDLGVIQGDLPMIRQLLVNVISNAFKYSSTKPVIKIKIGVLEDNDSSKVYYVKDNGVGFDMEYHDQIFGVFQRLHSDDDFEGTGVGLALAKRIVEKHGGKIWAKSEREVGTEIFFSIIK